MNNHRTRIKFCGFTRIDDLRAAVALGVDAVGFVCVPGSKRFIAPVDAAVLRGLLSPFVTSVLLLSNADEARAARTIATVNPDLVQFHGDETPEFCERFARPYIKSVSVRSAADVHAAAERFGSARALLLDSHGADGMGGTGQAFDWSQIPSGVDVPLILAGGLNPENVGLAVRMAAPFAVDVSSGIEFAPGRKDPDKMRAFVQAVRLADAEKNS
ncbi:MAG: phosphoribosylanthranilate isomerase [Panacagrimonas sp.]